MQTPYHLLVLSLVLSLGLPVTSTAQRGAYEKPNIILIFTDDLGVGDVGAFFQRQRQQKNHPGEPWMATPHLDALAAGGALLSDHYCAAPVCAPSRASLLLGVNQGHANVRDNQFDKALEDNHTVATVLRRAGYATAAIGKWGLQGAAKWDANGDEWPAYPLNRGFDYFLGYVRHSDGHEHYPKEGLYRKPKEVWENRTEISSNLDKCYTSDLWTAGAKRWIVETSGREKKPFFLYLAFDTPHAVLELPTQPYPEGGGLKGGLQWLDSPGKMINTASGIPDSWVHPDYAAATYDHDNDAATEAVPWPDTFKRYATSVRRIDSAVGDIIQLLKDLDMYSNTLIVFSSDNGPSLESYLGKAFADYSPAFFDSFGLFDGVKRDCLEGGIRMPTIASWPDHIPAGIVVSAPSASYDWLPTFADAAGIPAPASSDGVSLLPSLKGSVTTNQSRVYVEYFNNGKTPSYPEFHPENRGRKRGQMQMIRIGKYVGVRYDIQSHEDDFEIYDVVNDPSQTINLAVDGGMDSLQDIMHARVLQLRVPNETAPRPYDNEMVPPSEKAASKNGVTWRIFNGEFPWIPSVQGMTADQRGTSKRPGQVGRRQSEKPRLVLFEGYLRIPRGGKYTFFVNTPGTALLRIHEAAVVDTRKGGDDGHGSMLLQEGLHPFRLYVLEPAGSAQEMTFEWEGPDVARQQVPAAQFFRN